MAEAKSGDTVRVHYTGKLKDGTVFDSSEGRDPLEFELGGGKMIAGFEKAVLGMNVGENTTAEIPVDQAYGQKREEMMLTVPRDQVPADIKPEVGQQLALNQPDGRTVPVTVAEVNTDSILLDANHPLAGKDLIFEIELVEIV